MVNTRQLDVEGCLGCDLLAGRTALPGGIVHETRHWVVNHCVGPLNVGTLVVAPRRHVVAVAGLSDEETAEMGPLLCRSAQVIESLCAPEQVYACLWSHGEGFRRHLHIVMQPVTADLVQRFGGARAEQLQAQMMALGEAPPVPEVEAFCDRARLTFEGRH